MLSLRGEVLVGGLVVALLVSLGMPAQLSAQGASIDATVQCMPWHHPQNAIGGEGASDFGLWQRPIGTVRAAMIFVDFPDAPATETTQQVFDAIAAPAMPFYESVSYGALDLQIIPLHEWIRMPERSTAYELSRDAASGQTFEDYMAYVQTAVDLADPRFDFSDHDLLYVVASENADADYSPQQSAYPGDGAVADGTEIRQMATMGTDTRLTGFGTYVLPHETGHMFSLPDLYSYTEPESNKFAGPWDIMGDLSLGGGFTAWHKLKLEWLGVDDIACVGPEAQMDVEIAALGTAGGTKAAVVRTGPTTALVAEVRRPVGEDERLCDSGVLIYELDSTIESGEGPMRIRSANGSPEVARDYCGDLAGAAFDVDEQAVFEDAAAGVKIEVLSRDGNDYTIRVVNSGDFDAGSALHERTITASFGARFRFKGRVSVTDGFSTCAAGVTVQVQRKTPTGFQTVKSVTTNDLGNFGVRAGSVHGKRYRAVVPEIELSPSDSCGAAVSPTVRS